MQREDILRGLLKLPEGIRLKITTTSADIIYGGLKLDTEEFRDCICLVSEESDKDRFISLGEVKDIKIADFLLFESDAEYFFVDEERVPKGLFALEPPDVDEEILRHNLDMLFSREYKMAEGNESFCMGRDWTHAINGYLKKKTGEIIEFTNYPIENEIYVPFTLYLGTMDSAVPKIKRVFINKYLDFRVIRCSPLLPLQAKYNVTVAVYFKNMALEETNIKMATEMSQLYQQLKRAIRKRYPG